MGTKNIYMVLTASWLLILALIAPFRINAQQVCSGTDFNIYLDVISPPVADPDSGPLHQQAEYVSCGQFVLGSNSHAKLYQPNSTFQPSSSGDCGFPYPNSCRDLRVLVLLGSGFFAQMRSVSNNVIKFILPVIPSNGSTYGIYVQKQISPGVWVTTHGTGNDLTLEARHLHPFVNAQTYLQGSLYCHNGTFIKSLSDGQPNPRICDGQPTIIQAYATGIKNPADSWIYQAINSQGLEAGVFDTDWYFFSPGVYTLNFTRPGGWLPGSTLITFYYQGQGAGLYGRVDFTP